MTRQLILLTLLQTLTINKYSNLTIPYYVQTEVINHLFKRKGLMEHVRNHDPQLQKLWHSFLYIEAVTTYTLRMFPFVIQAQVLFIGDHNRFL